MKRPALLLLALAAACSDATGADRATPRLSFQLNPDFRDYVFLEPQASLTPGARGVSVVTLMTEQAPCRRFHADLLKMGDQLDVLVSIDRSAECGPALYNFTYTARVDRLVPGTYRLRVHHLFPQTREPKQVVLEEFITIP